MELVSTYATNSTQDSYSMLGDNGGTDWFDFPEGAADSMDNRLRPRYHFTPPANWMNDPNGLIQWKGIYHLFYQYLPDAIFEGDKHWGHAVSTDLVTWDHRPIALAPDAVGPDSDGCWSGAAVVDGDRVACVYSGAKGDAQFPCLAFAMDDGLDRWEKYSGNPVIAHPPKDIATTIFRDHSLWKEDGVWHQVIGSGIEGFGGAVLLYRSQDLVSWEYLGPLLIEDRAAIAPEWETRGWECPDFFAQGHRHVLTFSLWGKELSAVGYYSGTYADHRFVPDRHGLVDHGVSFYAPQSFFDESGRRIMISWLREECSAEMQLAHGWSGAMSLPRVLSLDVDGTLIQTPAPEVETLRGEHLHFDLEACDWFRQVDLGTIDGGSMEIDSRWQWDAKGLIGINLCSSANELERTVISLSIEDGELVVDTSESSIEPGAEGIVSRAVLMLEPDSPIHLRVFVDVSVIEVSVNDQTWIAARVYPSESEGGRLHISSTVAGAIDLWEMTPIHN